MFLVDRLSPYRAFVWIVLLFIPSMALITPDSLAPGNCSSLMATVTHLDKDNNFFFGCAG